MLEVNPQLTPAQVRDILQRTATPLPPYYQYEVGAGLLNAQAAVLEAAFPRRHFGGWRGIAYRGQVQFVNNSPQAFTGSSSSGSVNDSSIAIPADTVLASLQIAWGGLIKPINLNLSVLDPANTAKGSANSILQSGLTGGRQRLVINNPVSGAWKARVTNTTAPVASTLNALQPYTGLLQTTSARYAQLSDIGGLDNSSVAEIYQNFRGLLMWPIGQRFRPSFGVTRSDLAAALVTGARVPQYLPASSNYPDVRDRATMLFVESAQAAPGGALFPSISAGSNFQPDAVVNRLTAVVALVRAAGLRQQAESGTYTLTYIDAASIPSSLRGYVAVAVQNGLIKTDGLTFAPQATFTRLDLSHALARLTTLATQ